MADASELFAIFEKSLEPKLDINCLEWAEQYRILSKESSALPGKFRPFKFQEEMHLVFNDDSIETICCVMGSQISKTELLNNYIGYVASIDPGPILMVQTDIKSAKKFTSTRLTPMIRDNPILHDCFKRSLKNDSGDTQQYKEFTGGYIAIVGSNVPTDLASLPIRYLFLDEVDRYEGSAGDEGDPVNIASARTTTFKNRKIVMSSSPGNEGSSRIWPVWENSDKRLFHVPCPECQTEQVLSWEQVKWQKLPLEDGTHEHQTETAVYICKHCQANWSDSQRYAAVSRGRWIATGPKGKIAGFHLSTLYSPFVTLGELAEKWIASKDNPQQIKVFKNTILGELYKEEYVAINDNELMEHLEDYSVTSIPNQVLAITVGVDTQGDRFQYEIVGWGLQGESWSLEYGNIPNQPITPEAWEGIDNILDRKFKREDGVELSIRAMAIDSGGNFTTEIVNECYKRRSKKVFAIKGEDGWSRTIWPLSPSRNRVTHKPVYLLGVDPAKRKVFQALKAKYDSSKEINIMYCHFPAEAGYDNQYFRGLTAEELRTKYVAGKAKQHWHPLRKENEPLDCRVYALAVLEGLKLDLQKIKIICDDKAAAIAKGETYKLPSAIFKAPGKR